MGTPVVQYIGRWSADVGPQDKEIHHVGFEELQSALRLPEFCGVDEERMADGWYEPFLFPGESRESQAGESGDTRKSQYQRQHR